MPKHRRGRINSTIDKLPADVKQQVDEMLLDVANTYLDISEC